MSKSIDFQKVLVNHLIQARDPQDAYSRFTVWNDCMYTLGYDSFEIESMFLQAIEDNKTALRPFLFSLREFVQED